MYELTFEQSGFVSGGKTIMEVLEIGEAGQHGLVGGAYGMLLGGVYVNFIVGTAAGAISCLTGIGLGGIAGFVIFYNAELAREDAYKCPALQGSEV